MELVIKNKRDRSIDGLGILGKVGVSILMALLVTFSVSLILGSYFFGFAGLFKLLNVAYSSIASLILFTIVFFIVSIAMDLLAQIAFSAINTMVSQKHLLFFLRISCNIFFAWLTIYTLDEFMTSITIPLLTEFVVATLLVIIDEVFDDRWKVNKGKTNKMSKKVKG